MSKYKTIIGLEVHIEQNTESKMFCRCSGRYFEKEPNSNTCPVCLGLPGAMPFANKKAIQNTILFGLSFGCEIAKYSKFDRKHYFYPDLPKSFQISQYDLPLCGEGVCEFEFGKVRIKRIHQEEDTGKLTHIEENGVKTSLVDFNRSGVPLMEMVTEPDFSSADDVVTFLKYVQKVVRYLGISDADMEKGSMRLEANISLSSDGSLPNYKVELKNINSFKFLKGAIEAEIKRQEEALDSGEVLIQETRGYDQVRKKTVRQRVKETASDYRYFPEPDLLPIVLTDQDIEEVKKGLPELPSKKQSRFEDSYGISAQYAELLTEEKEKADFYELLVKETKLDPKKIAGEIINNKSYEGVVTVEEFLKLYERENPKLESDASVITDVVSKVLAANSDAVAKYKAGKIEVIGFLIGQVQRELRGKADPAETKKILENLLS